MSQVKERPILMCGEMVRATLEDRKTQTRRIAKLDPRMMEGEEADWCPYGRPGDRLWVKETFAPDPSHRTEFIYRADPASDYQWGAGKPSQGDFRWRPSIFMPRRVSRITLEIVSVRVERLQEITEEDAKAEGVSMPDGIKEPPDFWSYRKEFGFLWDSLNAKRGFGWNANPYVWRVEFKRIKP